MLRTFIGGWQSDFGGAGALIRMSELGRFETAARGAGAEFVACMLTDQEASALSRSHRRGDAEGDTAWHQRVLGIVEADGGDEELARYHRGLQQLWAHRPSTAVIHRAEGEINATYRALLTAVT